MHSTNVLRPERSPATASRVFSGEAVVITPADNTVRMLNPVGSRIWELADGRHTVDEIVDALVSEFAVDRAAAQGSVQHFIDELMEKGLLKWAE